MSLANYRVDDRVAVYAGDCREMLALLPDASVDAVVTDPPYELGFMGKRWDGTGIAYDPDVWAEALRVLKPGGHLLAFGGTRTWHRLAVAIEDAGFEVRDSIAWLYGSGFPKSLDVSKAIDKARNDSAEVLAVTSRLADLAEAAGITRNDLDMQMGTSDMGGWWLSRLPHRCACPSVENWTRLRNLIPGAMELDADVWRLNGRKGTPGEAWDMREKIGEQTGGIHSAFDYVRIGESGKSKTFDITAPATPDAERWQGWGTALKPAFEPVVVARKPLVGTVAANVLGFGVGALNVDGCRIGSEVRVNPAAANKPGGAALKMSEVGMPTDVDAREATGRWPANVTLDEVAAGALDEQSGVLHSQDPATRKSKSKVTGVTEMGTGESREYADTGGASRFFYVAKAPTKERVKVDGVAHPTVKPLTLMRWLVRLVTPPGGIVVEPFAGSGTTVEAAILEGFRVVASEVTPEYLPLVDARIDRAYLHLGITVEGAA